MLHSPHEKHMPNAPRRLFTFATTTTQNTMHFDSPSRQIYATTPVSQESRNILLSPKKAPRSISKVPFKVLDAPELRVRVLISSPIFLSRGQLDRPTRILDVIYAQCLSNGKRILLLADDRMTFT